MNYSTLLIIFSFALFCGCAVSEPPVNDTFESRIEEYRANDNTLGKQVLAARQNRDMTQAELGNLVGLTPEQVNAIETDLAVPTSDVLTDLAHVLGVRLTYAML